MQPIQAGTPMSDVPQWALLERKLLDLQSDAVVEVVDRYVHDDGRIRWPEDGGGLDDAYEGFSNWPLLYALGGADEVLERSMAQWEAITEQFSEGGTGDAHVETVDEFPASLDWMHQGEGHQFFYHICLAAPDEEQFVDRARRFADYYLAAGDVDNYDPEHHLVKGPESGSEGPSLPVDGPWEHAEWMVSYHLPFNDVAGIETIEDLKDPEKAARMSEVLEERWRGDVVANLAITSLMTTAYLLTGEDEYREWVSDYVAAWEERTHRNNGIIPDNVGVSGEVGEHLGGNWFGGYYGWTWPHGWLFIGDALLTASENATLLEGDTSHNNAARSTIDELVAEGIEHEETLYVPYRHSEEGVFDYDPRNYRSLGEERQVLFDDRGHVLWRDGWYEFRPIPPRHPVHLWRSTQEDADWDRLEDLTNYALGAPQRILDGTKDAAGNERAWAAYVGGEYPEYPERILQHSYEYTSARLADLREVRPEYTPTTDEFLNRRSPVDVEGLVQCTLGGPMPLYNGGLLHTRVRHFDPDRRRPGLPRDVAVLVTDMTAEKTGLEIVNLGCADRTLTVQAGTYGEHEFGRLTYEHPDDESGDVRTTLVDDSSVSLTLPGGCQSRCELETRRYVNSPSLSLPWDR